MTKGYRKVKIRVGYDNNRKMMVNKCLEFSFSEPKIDVSITAEKMQITHDGHVFRLDSPRIEQRNFLYIPLFFLPALSEIRRLLMLKREITQLKEMEKRLENAQKTSLEKKGRIETEKHLEKKRIQEKIRKMESDMQHHLKRIQRFLGKISVEQLKDKEEEISMVERALDFSRSLSFFLQRFLVERLYYIGPLREYPQRYYIASGEYPRDVGLRGEHTAEVIYFNFRRKPNHKEKLMRWMKLMDLAYDVKLSKVIEGIYALTITNPKLNIDVNLADVGFGTSQLLPIIVEGIYADVGSVLLMEQPEIHLHPRLQALLADFLIDVIKQGKQVIVETHSEHIIMRLQRRIAEGTISHNDVAIYSFELSENGTKISPVKINENGIIDQWPKGFFEEDFEEAYSFFKALGRKKDALPRG